MLKREKLPILYFAPGSLMEVSQSLRSGPVARIAGLPPLYQLPPKWSFLSALYAGICKGFLSMKEFSCNKDWKPLPFPDTVFMQEIYSLLKGLFVNICENLSICNVWLSNWSHTNHHSRTQRYMYKVFIAALFIIPEDWKQCKCLWIWNCLVW